MAELSYRADADPDGLSGGEQRRVAIARALINSPSLLLADEPTSDLAEDSETNIIDLLEQLQRSHSLVTFLIVGAGPTGVEMAGAIAELARNGMAKDFRNFDPASARILLVQAGPRVLPQFDGRLSAFARTSLEALGVEVRVDSRVEGIDAEGVVVSGERILAGTVLWAAGVVASPTAAWLAIEPDRAGRIKVGPDARAGTGEHASGLVPPPTCPHNLHLPAQSLARARESIPFARAVGRIALRQAPRSPPRPGSQGPAPVSGSSFAPDRDRGRGFPPPRGYGTRRRAGSLATAKAGTIIVGSMV